MPPKRERRYRDVVVHTAKPSLGMCSWHEVSYSSEYTRPTADVLREVLEMRLR